MKKILLTIGLAAGITGSAAAQSSITEAFTLAGAVASSPVVTNVINFPCKATRILLILNGPITSPHNYAVVDAPKYSLGNVNYGTNFYTTAVLELTNSISTMVSYLTNISLLITNYEGVSTNLYRSNVLYSTWSTAAATRTPYKRVLVGNTTAAGTITVYDSSVPLNFANGITFTNTASLSNATAVITYDPAL